MLAIMELLALIVFLLLMLLIGVCCRDIDKRLPWTVKARAERAKGLRE